MHSKFYIVTFFFLIFSSGCIQSRLENNLAEHSKNQNVTLKALQDAHLLKKRENISWDQAVRMLRNQNITLQRARDQIDNIQSQRKDQWLSLIPKIQGFAGLSTSLSDLADINSDDISARVLSSFNIPNPVSFYGRFYAISLQSLQAEWSYELTRRQQHAQLYTSFLEEKMLDAQLKSISQQEESIERSSIGKLADKVANLAQEKVSISRKMSYHRLAINRLLNTPGGNWKPHGETPIISYEDNYKDLKLGDGFGKLALKLQTLQIEASALAILSVKLERFPRISQSLSSPVIFSNDDNTDTGFTADNFFLFTGLSKTIDLTDIRGKRNLRKAEVRENYTRAQLKLSMESEILRLKMLKQSYASLQGDFKKTMREKLYIRGKNTNALNTTVEDLTKYQELEKESQSLNTQIARMDIQFWIWDEVYWAKN